MFISDGLTIPIAPPIDLDATMDYGFTWAAWLASGETIVTSTWITGLTTGTESNTGIITTVFLSGGILGTGYTLTNRVITSLGRTEDRSMTIFCENK